MANNFKVGDIVTKLYGKKPAEITYVSGNGYGYSNVHCKYLESRQTFYANANELKIYEGDDEEMAETKTLYSFTKDDGTVAYGTHIGTNSSNQYLIEEKVTGQIHVLDKKNLEEVLPYTFSAKMGTSENHYVGTPDALKKGDILLYTTVVVEVSHAPFHHCQVRSA